MTTTEVVMMQVATDRQILDGLYGKHIVTELTPVEYMTYAAAVLEAEGKFVSVADAQKAGTPGISTKSRVGRAVHEGQLLEERHVALARAARNWIMNDMSATRNDYLRQCRAFAGCQTVSRMAEGFLTSLIPAYQKATQPRVVKVVDEPANSLRPVQARNGAGGVIGNYSTGPGTLSGVKSLWQGVLGERTKRIVYVNSATRGNGCYINQMEDPWGNLYVWFSTGTRPKLDSGAYYSLSGKVKEHELRFGDQKTHLTECLAQAATNQEVQAFADARSVLKAYPDQPQPQSIARPAPATPEPPVARKADPLVLLYGRIASLSVAIIENGLYDTGIAEFKALEVEVELMAEIRPGEEEKLSAAVARLKSIVRNHLMNL